MQEALSTVQRGDRLVSPRCPTLLLRLLRSGRRGEPRYAESCQESFHVVLLRLLEPSEALSPVYAPLCGKSSLFPTDYQYIISVVKAKEDWNALQHSQIPEATVFQDPPGAVGHLTLRYGENSMGGDPQFRFEERWQCKDCKQWFGRSKPRKGTGPNPTVCKRCQNRRYQAKVAELPQEQQEAWKERRSRWAKRVRLRTKLAKVQAELDSVEYELGVSTPCLERVNTLGRTALQGVSVRSCQRVSDYWLGIEAEPEPRKKRPSQPSRLLERGYSSGRTPWSNAVVVRRSRRIPGEWLTA